MDPHPPTDPVVASAFFEAAPDALLIFDAAGRIVQANGTSSRFFGYPREALLGMAVEDLVPERLRGGHAGRREGYQGDQDRRPLHGLELVARHRDGRELPVEIALSTVGEGAAQRTLAAVRDIAPRKAIEATLAASKARLRSILAMIPVAVAVFDREMRYLVVSERWRADYGLGDQPLIGRSHFDVFPELDEAIREHHRRGLEGIPSSAVADRVELGEGKVVYGDWSLVPWREADGTIGGVILCTEDVTARELALQALARSEASLAEAQALAAVGSWEWDLVGGGISWSAEALRQLGGPMPGAPPTYEAWLAALHPDDRAAADAAVRQAREDGRPFDFVCRIAGPGGTPRVLHQIGQADPGEDGKPARLRVTSQDVTAQRELERQLRAQFEQLTEHRHRQRFEQLRDAFVDAVAHDLKNPLGIVLGYADMLALDAGEQLPGEAQELLAAIQAGARGLGGMLDELTDVVRAKADGVALERADVELAIPIRASVERFMLQSAAKLVRCDLQLPAAPLPVFADARRLEQVLGHLLREALKASPRGGRIVVEARPDGREVRCEIRHEGAASGTGPLFDRFIRVGEVRNHAAGLGLYVSKLLVEAHGGRVGATADATAGTTIWFTLPAGPPRA